MTVQDAQGTAYGGATGCHSIRPLSESIRGLVPDVLYTNLTFKSFEDLCL